MIVIKLSGHRVYRVKSAIVNLEFCIIKRISTEVNNVPIPELRLFFPRIAFNIFWLFKKAETANTIMIDSNIIGTMLIVLIVLR